MPKLSPYVLRGDEHIAGAQQASAVDVAHHTQHLHGVAKTPRNDAVRVTDRPGDDESRVRASTAHQLERLQGNREALARLVDPAEERDGRPPGRCHSAGDRCTGSASMIDAVGDHDRLAPDVLDQRVAGGLGHGDPSRDLLHRRPHQARGDGHRARRSLAVWNVATTGSRSPRGPAARRSGVLGSWTWRRSNSPLRSHRSCVRPPADRRRRGRPSRCTARRPPARPRHVVGIAWVAHPGANTATSWPRARSTPREVAHVVLHAAGHVQRVRADQARPRMPASPRRSRSALNTGCSMCQSTEAPRMPRENQSATSWVIASEAVGTRPDLDRRAEVEMHQRPAVASA